MTGRVRSGMALAVGSWAAALAGAGCAGTMPSQTVDSGLRMPVPQGQTYTAATRPTEARLPTATQPATSQPAEPTHFVLVPMSIIRLTFNRQPAIKADYHAFKAEEARYDFFYTSRDAFTPGVRLANELSGDRDPNDGKSRQRTHEAEFFVTKQFFDTSRLDLAAGYRAGDEYWGGDRTSHSFVKGSLLYPLWTSRPALQRASEDIERQNDLRDAQLEYLQTVRFRVRESFFYYSGALRLGGRVAVNTQWLQDLRSLARRVQATQSASATEDLQRVEAEIETVDAEYRDLEGRRQVEVEAVKGAIGLPFDASIDILDKPFNPFAGRPYDQIIAESVAHDPEIAILNNAVRSAEAQLDLARRGKWDASLELAGESNLEGTQDDQGESYWNVTATALLSAVDPRITSSLEREALANIERNREAIRARKNEIHVEAIGPMVRLDTLRTNVAKLTQNLPRYVEDYEKGLAEYDRGALNIDDLLARRRTLAEQQTQIVHARQDIVVDVARLCAATGKYFDLVAEATAAPGSGH